ncbi:hypothetical protein ACVW00_000368 [Marmoricola sp. URHA0025 HA25]
MKSILRRTSLPHLVVFLAIALVLGSGTAYAAGQITSKQIKNNTIKGIDVRDGTLTGIDVADGGLSSADILDGTITSADVALNALTAEDLAANSVTSSELANDSVTSAKIANGSVTSADVADETLTSADLATDSVQATEVADNSLDSGEIIDFGLSNEDIGVLEAEVNADGSLADSDHFGTTSSNLGTGSYAVDFGINVSFCTPVVTQGEAGVGGAGGAIAGVTDRSGNANAFFVTMRDAAGAGINTAFHIVVVC